MIHAGRIHPLTEFLRNPIVPSPASRYGRYHIDLIHTGCNEVRPSGGGTNHRSATSAIAMVYCIGTTMALGDDPFTIQLAQAISIEIDPCVLAHIFLTNLAG